MVGKNACVDAMIRQLPRAIVAPLVEQVRQDHDVAMLGQPVDTMDRAVDRHLAMHLGIEVV